MANNKVRVVIPQNADEYLILIDRIIAQEDKLPPNGMLNATELQQLKDLREEAFKANKEKGDYERLAEEKTRTRDLAFGRAKGQGVNTPNTCEYLVTKVRDKALADNKTNPKALGAWGFEVDDSPRSGDEPPTP